MIWIAVIALEAADERIAALEAALKEIANPTGMYGDAKRMRDLARAALGVKP